jgi:hypothetical protein
VHDGPEGSLDGPGEDGGSLGSASNPPSLLLGGLVEPGLNMVLPRLVEVAVGDQIVVLRHLGLALNLLAKEGPATSDTGGERKKEGAEFRCPLFTHEIRKCRQ